MASQSQNNCSDTPENFGIEDCEALLEFPYHDYASEVKQEVILEPNGESKSFVNSNSDDIQLLDIKTEPNDNGSSSTQEECLKLNKALQIKIIQNLTVLETALQKNLTKQDELIELTKEVKRNISDDKLKHTKPISLFAAPYFRDVRGMVPPDNEDTIVKLKRNDVTAYLTAPKPWTRTEKDRLIEGVAANALSLVLKPYKSKRDYLKSKLKDKQTLEFEMEILVKQIRKLEEKIKIESERPLSEILEETNGKLDWMIISATNLQGAKSEEECEIMWNNYLSNSVNKGPFTAKEDKYLKKYAEQYKEKRWDRVTEKLQTGRTAIQCLERYQTHLNPDITKKYWTPEEDNRLREVVESLKVGTYIPWNKVSCYMGGWTRHQITNRYERTVSREIKRSRFTTEEDAMVLACVRKFGFNWSKMKDLIPGRPSYSIRERYVNALDPTLKIGEWTKEEDKLLIKLIKIHGYGRWANIARGMCGRTDNMCLVRAKTMKMHTKRKYADELKGKNKKELEIRPIAPTKNCIVQNNRLKVTQNSALCALKSALQKIKPLIRDNIDMETLDLSSVSVQTLQVLKDELLSKQSDDENSNEEWVPHYVPPHFQKQKFREVKQIDIEYASSPEVTSSDEKDTDEDEFVNLKNNEDDENFLSISERLHLYDILFSRLKADVFLAQSRHQPKPVALNSKEEIEFEYYKSYLKKKMFIRDQADDEMDNIDSDYENRITDVIRYFVQPDVEEGQPMVMCPNFATLTALEVIEATRPRLNRTASFVEHSKAYLRYLIDYGKPECTKCTDSKFSNMSGILSAVLKAMENKNLIVDEDFTEAAKVETGFPSKECVCKELEKSKEDFNLLQKRFMSIFLWPYLLSTIDLSGEQEAMIRKSGTATHYKRKSSFGVQHPKRGRRQQWMMKKSKKAAKRLSRKIMKVEEAAAKETHLSKTLKQEQTFSVASQNRKRRRPSYNEQRSSFEMQTDENGVPSDIEEVEDTEAETNETHLSKTLEENQTFSVAPQKRKRGRPSYVQQRSSFEMQTGENGVSSGIEKVEDTEANETHLSKTLKEDQTFSVASPKRKRGRPRSVQQRSAIEMQIEENGVSSDIKKVADTEAEANEAHLSKTLKEDQTSSVASQKRKGGRPSYHEVQQRSLSENAD